MPTNIDEYADLPDWIRPGAPVANLSYRDNYSLLTVTRITRTQIVCTSDANSNGVYRFKRVPENRFYDNEGPQYRLIGVHASGSRLVQRDHPTITGLRIDSIARRVTDDVAETRKRYGNPKADGDTRPREERALSMLDEIENATRVARRRILTLLAPTTEETP